VVSLIGWESSVSWGIIAANFAYNPQFNWYINNMDIGTFYQRDTISDMLINDGVKKNDATSIINAFKRFCGLPFGTALNWGAVYENGRQIDSLYRNKCTITDNRVILYSLLLFTENCKDNKEFTLSWLMDDSVERNGISPVKIFGLDYEEMKSALMGLSQKYPDYLIVSFTNDLDKISVLNKRAEDVILLFEEEE
jgi:phosphoadenosine phosphosulfate reductase